MIGELFTRYGSDKDTEHSYGPVYDELFGPIRDKVTAFLEIGIARGGSLRAWRDYFPNATIVGIDHHADLVFEERIVSFRADSTDPVSLKCITDDPWPPFDVIVDDGCHWHKEQRTTWENLYPTLIPGGIYVVEDIQADDGVEVFKELGAEIINRRAVKCRGDDVLAVFRKPL